MLNDEGQEGATPPEVAARLWREVTTSVVDLAGISVVLGIVLWGIGGIDLRLSASISMIIAILVVGLGNRWKQYHSEIVDALKAVEGKLR